MDRDELSRRIHALCEARSMHFRPWEPSPWLVTEDPEPPEWATGIWRERWPQAAALRRRLIAELGAEK